MSGNLEGKVYEMQALKQSYGINSTNAHAFMRSKAAYEQLCDAANRALKPEGIRVNLSWQEISNLCQGVVHVIKDALNEAHFPHTGDFNHLYVRDFNDDLLHDRVIPLARYIPGKPGLIRLGGHGEEETFEFDYGLFLQTFARVQAQVEDRQESFRQAFLIFKDSQDAYLTSPKGEKLSYRRFVETVMEYGQAMAIEEITHDEIMIAESARVREGYGSIVEEFLEWQMTGSQNYTHARVKFDKVAAEERKFLYGLSNEDDPYERAVRERTERRLETERSIALHFILGNYDLIGDRAEIITRTVKELIEARDRRKERHELLMRSNAPSVVVDREKMRVERTQYTLNAVRKNKSWLEEILNR